MDKEEICKSKILEKVGQDTFLGVQDQQPLIEEILVDFQESFSRFRQRIADQLEQRKKILREGLLKSQADLDQVRSGLVDAFQCIKQRPPGVASLRAVVGVLEKSVADLYQSMPANLGAILKQTSPERRPIQNLLGELNAFHREVMKGIPIRAVLIRRRKVADGLGGKSIFDVERKALTTFSNSSRFALVNRLLFRLYRLGLRYRYRLIEVPLRETISEHLFSFKLLDEGTLVSEHKIIHSESISRVSDSWQVVRFNLEVAAAELSETVTRIKRNMPIEETESGTAEIEQLALGALERAQEKLNDIHRPFETLVAEFLRQMDQEHQANLALIRQDIEEAGTLRVRLRWTRNAFRRSLKSYRVSLAALGTKAFRQGSLFGKQAFYQLEDTVLNVAPSWGLAVRPRESLLRLTDLPTYGELSRKTKNLPPVYRRLFSPAPLLTKEFLVGREKELSLLLESAKRWQAGLPCSVVLVGPQGSGKTSLLNCFANEMAFTATLARKEIGERLCEEEEVFRLFESWFALTESFHSVPELVTQLLQLPKQIILVEGGHNLMLRTIGGGKTAETFFAIILATRDHLLWILSVRQYPWQRMEYQLKASQYFTHEIRTLFHSVQELHQGLTVRQRTSGFRMLYSDQGLEKRRIRRLRLTNPLESEVVQKELEKEYFEDLFKMSGGNIESALFFWLLSLSHEESENAVRVAPCITLDYHFLRGFDTQYLFTLAELMNHGGLTAAEHSKIFRLEPARSQLVLDYLVEIRLVECKIQDEERTSCIYIVNPILIHPVASMLESMNILY